MEIRDKMAEEQKLSPLTVYKILHNKEDTTYRRSKERKTTEDHKRGTGQLKKYRKTGNIVN
jgi:hypothetical protein